MKALSFGVIAVACAAVALFAPVQVVGYPCTSNQSNGTAVLEQDNVPDACPSLYGNDIPVLVPGQVGQLTDSTLTAIQNCSLSDCLTALQKVVSKVPNCTLDDFNPRMWYQGVFNLCEALASGKASVAEAQRILSDGQQPTSAPDVAPTTSPSEDGASKSGNSTSTTVAAVGGSLVVVVLGIFAIMRVRRKRREKPELPGTPHATTPRSMTHEANPTGAYVYMPSVKEKQPELDELLEGGALADARIPYESLTFGDVLSQGGFGEVASGFYNSEKVAVKRLLRAHRMDKKRISSFVKEIQLTATLHHENIVNFIGVAWDTPSNICMVSEFMVGGDLRSLLASYADSGHANGYDETKLKISIHVAEALEYLHALPTPVVHRDLKSRNILLSGEGDAKLIDFGVSCECRDVTMTAGIGTSLWMAPEVMLGKRYDQKADVFSFGVLLSELDTHELPYDNARDTASGQRIASMQLMHLISRGTIKPRFTEMADPQILALARDCLEVDPRKRPSSSQVIARMRESCRKDQNIALDTRTALNLTWLTHSSQSEQSV